MGCCQSRALEEPDFSGYSVAPIPDTCYPDKLGYGGVKVFASTASIPGSNSSSSGRTHTRLVIGDSWLFAALFESHYGSDLMHPSEAAARFCAQRCYTEFQLAANAAGPATEGSDGKDMRSILTATIKALDRRFLADDDTSQQDRLASGCTGVLLYVSLGKAPRATGASVGPCAAVVGQRRGGLASATSAPKLLCGGEEISHTALQEFLATLAVPKLPETEALLKQQSSASHKKLRSVAAKKLRGSSRHQHQPASAPLMETEPEYSLKTSAPQALGFGFAKGLRLASPGRSGATADELRPEPKVGLEVQTACHDLGPADDCLVLLSGGAAAGIAPADVALLMHRMGGLAGIPYEAKPEPLRMETSPGSAVQLDNLGTVGPRPQMTPDAAFGITPFNAARLLVQHAASNEAARAHSPSAGTPAGVIAFALEWPRTSDDSASASAACGASVTAVRAAAAAAANSRQRAQYRWQLLRLYYKYPHKRHLGIMNRWHEIFDRVLGEGRRTANLKETVAWLRLRAAVKVSAAGNVQCLTPLGNDDVQQPVQPESEPQPQLQQAQFRRASPAPIMATARPSRSSSGRALNTSPLWAMSGSRGRLPAPALYKPISSPGMATSVGNPSQPSTSASGHVGGGPRSPSIKSAQHDASPYSSPTRPASAQEVIAGAMAVSRSSLVASSSKRNSRVGLLEAEGIILHTSSRSNIRGQGVTEGGSEPFPIPNPTRMSWKSAPGDGSVGAATAADGIVHGVGASMKPLRGIPKEVDDGAPGGDSTPCTPKGIDNVPAEWNEEGSDSTMASATADAIAATTGHLAGCTAGLVHSTHKGGPPPGELAAARDGPSSISSRCSSIATARNRARSAVTTTGRSPVSTLAAGATATDVNPPSSRSFGLRSPRSRIPTLKPYPILQPSVTQDTSGSAAVFATPRLSMPGGNATPRATPPTRVSTTWGGASQTTPTSTAPNSARSGSSRLPRPPNLATSAASSTSRTSMVRPPRLDVTSPVNAPLGTAAVLPGVEEFELFSPDAEQLAVWAMEAVDAIGSVSKKEPEHKNDPGSANSSSKAGNSASSGGARLSSGGARRTYGSRIPLSPRTDFNTPQNDNISANYNGSIDSKLSARSASRGSVTQSRGSIISMRTSTQVSVGTRNTELTTPRRVASER